MLKKIVSLIAILSILCCNALCFAATDDEKIYNISITNETKQTVKGFGVFPAFTDDFDGSKAAAAKAVFADLGVDTFRVELLGQAGRADSSVNLEFLQPMLDIIKFGKQFGVTTYTVHVWSPPAAFKSNNSISGKMSDGSPAYLMEEHEQDYCDWIVNCFDYITKVAKLDAPTAFSIQNEPENAFDYQSCAYSQEQYVRVIKLMRKTLDDNGYGDVLLLGAEGGAYLSNPRWFGEGYSLLETDKELYDAVGAFCTHTYVIEGYTKDEDVNQFVENTSKFPEKDKWQTEFSNSTMLGRDKMIDKCIEAMRVFAADMEWGGINYWSWWLGWHSTRVIDVFEQETLIEGDGVTSVRKSQHFYAFEKIYNSVDVGAKVVGVNTDDPEIKNSIAQQTDLCAFTDGSKNTLMFINTSDKDKNYRFTNLLGKSAEVYNLADSADYRPVLLRSSNITNGAIAPIEIPARSVTIITTSTEDTAPPLITFGNNSSLSYDEGVYVSRDKQVTLEVQVDEKATVMIDKIELPLSASYTFCKDIKLTNQAKRYRIDAIDLKGNYARPMFIDVKYDPDCTTIELDKYPASSNTGIVTLSGRTNVDATVHIADQIVQTENKMFKYEYELDEGENNLIVYAEDAEGNRSKELTVIVLSDTIAPEITIDAIPATVNDAEVIIKGAVSEPVSTFEINGSGRKINGDNSFASKLLLESGNNSIVINAQDVAGNIVEKTIDVYYDKNDTSARVTDAVTYSKRIDTDINIDGILSDEEWSIDNKAVKVYYGGETNNILNFGTAWNDKYLFVGVDVKDEYLSFEDEQVYNNDCVEVFINGDGKKGGSYNSTDKQLFIGYSQKRGMPHDNGSDIKTAWNDTVYGYQAEMAIPWELFNITPAENVHIGFDVLVDDNDYTEKRESIVGWCGTSSNWESTANFGTLILCNAADVKYMEKSSLQSTTEEIKEEITVEDTDAIKVYLNGERIVFPISPVMTENRVMVPVRVIAEANNAKVLWDDNTQSVTIIRNDKTIIFNVYDNNVVINGESLKNDIAAFIMSDTTFVPLRFLSECLGMKVLWDGTNNTVEVFGV